MVHECLQVARDLEAEGWDIEIVDLRSVKPIDTDTILASVARTGRILAVGEGFPVGRRDRTRSRRPGGFRWVSPARCATAASQLPRYTDSLSSESLDKRTVQPPKASRTLSVVYSIAEVGMTSLSPGRKNCWPDKNWGGNSVFFEPVRVSGVLPTE